MKGHYGTGDYTRPTSRNGKHYSTVRMQQGRVQLDSDWNEEVDIIDHRWRATLEDVVGASGVPKVGGGFAITNVAGLSPQDLLLSPGRMYVDGILCEIDAEFVDAWVLDSSTLSVPGFNAGQTVFAKDDWIEVWDSTGKVLLQSTLKDAKAAVATTVTLTLNASLPLAAVSTAVRVRPIITYRTQPDLPSPPEINMATLANQYFGRTYIAYLDVFQRHQSALDDPEIREVALNGPDTGTRNRTTWQVRLLDVTDLGPNASCTNAPFPPASTGRMQARAVPTSDPTQDCLLPAEAGYRRLENQLYRVEIHAPGDYGKATFKWSRDNGSVVVAWTGMPQPDQIAVKGTPQDSAAGFASGQWVELTDDVHELSPEPDVLGIFVRLAAPEGDVLPFDSATSSFIFKDFPRNPKVRRWESPGAIQINAVGADGWISLEDGVEVKFQPGGQFNKGDYWLIPARTATTDVEWPNDPPGNPVVQLPDGVDHRYCGLALIQVHSGGTLTVLDCRPQFPALTAIAASDVSYDNAGCKLVNAANVQQAIDALCKNEDLAHHNKLIHGYGIVGGLQLECDKKKGDTYVKLRSGYAIDCDGKDIEVLSDADYDMGFLMKPLPTDGEVSLIIGLDQNAQVQVTAEPYKPPPSEVSEILRGTLLLDLFEDCALPFLKFISAELQPKVLKGDPPITGAQELASAFVNLLGQGPNPQSGQNVYISVKEQQLLSTFYNDLRTWLHSDTFCALFDAARSMPAPAAKDAIGHMFGMGHHSRIKIRFASSELFTIGNGSDPTQPRPRINRYDGNGLLIEQIDPTVGAGVTGPIQDIAFSLDGNTIYVSLADASHTNTIFRVGSMTTKPGVTWTSLATISKVLLVKLQVDFSHAGDWLLATGMTNQGTASNPQLIGAGVYIFRPAAWPNGGTVSLQAASSFNACGHLEIDGGFVFATMNSNAHASPTTYDTLRLLTIVDAGKLKFFTDIALPSPGGSDGLAVTGTPRVEVYVVIGGGTAPKTITGYFSDPKTGAWLQIPDSLKNPMAVPVDNSQIRMVASGSNAILMWASLDSYTVNAVDLTTHRAVANWTLPAQVGPIDMVWGGQGLAILNQPSDSILLVPQQLIDATQAKQTQGILHDSVTYHKAAVEAYFDLLAGFLQYLKDCFCHHLLVKTADCTPASKKLYLGCVSIRAGKVHNVCNFSQRHYLKTFPTMGYWLSLFPIVPIIAELIEVFCCYVIPDRFAKYSVPTYVKPAAGSTPSWTLQSLFETMQDIQQWDVRGKVALLMQQFGLARHVVGFSAGFRQLPPPPTPPPAGFVIGTSVMSAQGALAQGGLAAQPVAFRPALNPQLLNSLVDIFRPPAGPSGPVTLNQAAGQVVFTSNPPAQPQVADLQQQLQAKDAQLQQMQTQLQAVTAQVQELHVFRQQVTSLLGGNQGPAGGAPPAP